MPRRISAAEAATMDLEPVDAAPRKVSADEAAKMDLEPVDADPLLPQEAAPPAEMKDRRTRVLEAIKSLPGQAKRLAGKAMDAQYQAVRHPVETAKDLTDFSPEGTGGALVRSFGKGASLGFIDELDGLTTAGAEFRRPIMSQAQREAEGLPEKPQSYMDAYRRGRDQRRHDDAVSQAASPDAFGYGQFLGAATTPTAKLGGTGALGRLTTGAVAGGAYGLGASDADLTKGETAPAARDMGEGAFDGLATAAAVEPVNQVGRFSEALKHRASLAEEARVAKEATKDFASARGGLGSDTRQTLTSLKDAEAIANAAIPQGLSPEDAADFARRQAQARGFLQSDLGRRTRATADQNMLDDLPYRLNQMEERRAAMGAAQAGTEPEAVAGAAQRNLNKSVILEDIAPRVDRLTHNAVFSTMAGSIGAPMTTMKNLATTPRVQFRSGQVGETVAKPLAAAASAARPGATQSLEDYLRPMSDEEREKQGVDWFTSQ